MDREELINAIPCKEVERDASGNRFTLFLIPL